MLLKTNRGEMAVFRLSTMLMKTNELNYSLHDVDENKQDSRRARFSFLVGHCRGQEAKS
jgi:hypothetical protein